MAFLSSAGPFGSVGRRLATKGKGSQVGIPQESTFLFPHDQQYIGSALFLSSHSHRQLLNMTCQVANALKSQGVKRGDSVAIYMPASPLLPASMLACARIGAIHRLVCFFWISGSPK